LLGICFGGRKRLVNLLEKSEKKSEEKKLSGSKVLCFKNPGRSSLRERILSF